MKKLIIPFLLLSLLACKGQKSEVNKETKPAESAQWLNFKGSSDKSKHIVLISGDEEYRSEEALPQLAKILSTHHGFNCTVLFAQDPKKSGIINANYGQNIPGLEALNSADLMIIFTRFRALPDNQMQIIDDYLKTGNPVIGIRTATHAFNFGEDSKSNFKHYSYNYKGDKTEWEGGFGRLILGETWISHHGKHKHQSTFGIVAEGVENHPITSGIENGNVWGSTDVYGVRLPLPGDSKPIILGQVMNRKGEFDENDIFYGMKPTDDEIATTDKKGVNVNNPMMPVSWVKSYKVPNGKKGKVFTTTVGAASDMLIEGTRRLLVNGVFWTLDEPVPAKANVNLVGEFNPSAYGFRKNEYWGQKQLKITDFK